MTYMKSTLLLTTVAVAASSAEARTHFNSREKLITNASASPRHRNLFLADADGDGKKDLIGYTQDAWGWEISVGNATTYTTPLKARLDSHANPSQFRMPNGAVISIQHVFAGRFTDRVREDICFRSTASGYYWESGLILCFRMTGGTLVEVPGSRVTAPPAWRASHAYTVGDFDGDGFDELLTYDGGDGRDAMVFEYNPAVGGRIDYGFWNKADFDRGNLTGFSSPGAISMLVGNFADHWGEGTRDDLFVFNHTTKQSWVFHGRRDGAGRTTFWVRSGPSGAITTGAEWPTLADADGNGYEDLILHDRNYGNLRFLSLGDTSLYQPLPYGSPVPGQLPWFGSATEHYLLFGELNTFSEGGGSERRDDAIAFIVPWNEYRAYDARYCASGCGSAPMRTYWWRWTSSVSSVLANLQMTYLGMP